MTDLLVIHDYGTDGGAPWAAAFAGWDGEVSAPDLPGHADEPAPVGGHHEIGDAVFVLAERLSTDGERPVLVGVGFSGAPAITLALAGRASALVLVDGLGGPWLDVVGRAYALRAMRRKILSTPTALAPHSPGTTDVRASMVVPQVGRDHVVRSLAALRLPTLVVESPASTTPDAADLVAGMSDARLVDVSDAVPHTVATVVRDWRLTTRSTPRP